MLQGFINAIAQFIGRFFNKDSARQSRYSLQIFEERRLAATAAQALGIAAMVRSGHKNKWLLFMCPCGCKQQIALNLRRGTPRDGGSTFSHRHLFQFTPPLILQVVAPIFG